MLAERLLQSITAIVTTEEEAATEQDLNLNHAYLTNCHDKRLADFVSDLLTVEAYIQIKHDQFPPFVIKGYNVAKKNAVV